jgi:hypothetical protein
MDRLLRGCPGARWIAVKQWRQPSALRSALVATTCFSIVVTPFLSLMGQAYADEIIDEANKGQDTGANLLLNYQLPSISNAPPGSGLGPNELNIQELFPGYNPADSSQITNLSDLANDPSDLSTQGVARQFTLGAGTDETAEAYQSIDEGTVNPNAGTFDLRNDDFLDRTREIISGNDPILDEILTACAEDVTAGDPGADTLTRLEDIWTCSQLRTGTAGTCTVERDFVLVARDTRAVLTVAALADDGTCGSGYDIDRWGLMGWQQGINASSGDAWNCLSPTAPSGNFPSWYVRIAGGWLSSAFCGDLDVNPPSNTECAQTALELEHICRNALPSELNPSEGPVGSCTGIDSNTADPVDYSGCTAERQTYCEGFAAEFEDECSPLCGATGASTQWTLFQPYMTGPNFGMCRVREQGPFVNLASYPPLVTGFDIDRFWKITPGEPGDDKERIWADYYCGDHTGRNEREILNACTESARQVYNFCNQSILPCTGVGCILAINRTDSCDVIRNTHFSACANPSGSSPDLLNGTETIVSPGLGPGFEEVLADQDVFGTTVDYVENAFNPSDYGLVAGEYVIADHQVTGDGITGETIDDGGSYGSNWDWTSTITLADSAGFAVEATIYEIVNNGFIFTGCSQADVQSVNNGTCSGSITCTDYTPPCRVVDGVEVCEAPSHTYGITEVLESWNPFASTVPELCWFANVNIVDCVGQTNCIGNPACVNDCGDLPPELRPACEGDACWIDAQGNEICLDDTSETWTNNLGDPNYVDDCREFLDRDECQLLPDVACIEGMESDVEPGNIDLCNLRQRFFDCGTEVTVPGTPGADDVDVTCGAEVRCFGDECANTEAESNPDFIRAAVAGTTVTESTKDMECDIAGDPTSCTIFEGTDNRCKDPRGSYLGLIPDCCDESRQAGASAGDFVTYMQLARHSFRLARDPIVASWLAQGAGLPSALQNVVETPATIGRHAGRAVATGFNTALDWAGFTPIDIATEAEFQKTLVDGSTTGFGPLQQFIAGGVRNFLTSIGHEQFADSLFQTTFDGQVTGWAADGLGQMIGNALNVIGFIYTVYSILKILGSIFFACEEEELAFGIQQVNRACHHVGTYCSKKVSFLGFKKCVIETQTFCCFSSPFARIINEQLRLQGIGPDWGTGTEPNCEGIAITELDSVDWSLVDLSEWEAIMFEAGLVPDPRNPPLNFVPTARHPGVAEGGPSGSNEGATSTDIMQEKVGIVMPVMDEGRFDLDGEPLHQPDPELMPWYDDGG